VVRVDKRRRGDGDRETNRHPEPDRDRAKTAHERLVDPRIAHRHGCDPIPPTDQLR